MTKGYLVMAQGDYVSQAEALAKSITCTQSSTNKISVITDGNPDPTLFDHVIPLEKDISGNSTWKIHNRVQFYELSPYDETVILDADMLFLSDVSHWWTHMSTYELLLTNHVVNFRGDTVTQSPYRRTFTGNKLPNVYSAFAYFKKTVFVKDFFQLVENIIVNWSEWTDRYAARPAQDFPSLDVAMAIAVKILDCENQVTTNRSYPTFTHMKSGCQGWKMYDEDWQKMMPHYVYNKRLKLGNYVQSGVLHYVKKNFVNDDIMSIFE
jgi:hypothetical protein